jgi:probable phosphoglycerate mutase
MRLILVRHGESHSNAAADRVALPEAEGDRLTERGRRQAEEAAGALADLGASRLIASTMHRAAETAAILSGRLGLPVQTSELIHELREIDGYGALDAGEQREQRWSKRMAAHADDPDHAPRGAESFAGIVGRVRAFKAELAGQPDESVQVAVSHGIYCRFFLLDSILGPAFTPADLTRIWHLRTINCGLSVFTLGERGRATDPPTEDWACLSWMSPPGGPAALGAAGRPASAATAR